MKPSSSFGRRPRERSESQSSEASQPGELKPSSSFGRKKDSKLSKISRSLSWNTRKKREGGGPAEAIEALGEAGGRNWTEFHGWMARLQAPGGSKLLPKAPQRMHHPVKGQITVNWDMVRKRMGRTGAKR